MEEILSGIRFSVWLAVIITAFVVNGALTRWSE